MLSNEVLRAIASAGGRILHTGSRVICDPAPTDTDADYAVYISTVHYRAMFRDWLVNDGWEMASSGAYIDEEEEEEDYTELFRDSVNPTSVAFMSFKKGEDNIILLASGAAWAKWVTATALAKQLNLTDKAHRCNLFSAILYEELYCPPTLQLKSIHDYSAGTPATYRFVSVT